MKYIAYGSNMVQEQMAFRCPDARLIGTGYIAGARLESQRGCVPAAELNSKAVPAGEGSGC